MSAPVQFRYFHRKYTLDDARAGHPVITDRDGQIYIPNVLQFRYKMRVTIAGAVEMQWSAWQPVPVVKEGSPEDTDSGAELDGK